MAIELYIGSAYLQHHFLVRVIPIGGEIRIESSIIPLRALLQLHFGQIKVDQSQNFVLNVGRIAVEGELSAAPHSLIVQIRANLGQDIGYAPIQDWPAFSTLVAGYPIVMLMYINPRKTAHLGAGGVFNNKWNRRKNEMDIVLQNGRYKKCLEQSLVLWISCGFANLISGSATTNLTGQNT